MPSTRTIISAAALFLLSACSPSGEDVTTASSASSPASTTPGSASNGSGSEEAETIYGFWELVAIDGERPVRQPTITFTLEPSLNTDQIGPGYLSFTGFDGCNSFGGAYAVTSDHFEAPSIGSTLIGCGAELDDQAERTFSALRNSEWSITDGQLTLTGETGTMAVLEVMETEGAVGVWTLIEVDSRPVDTNASLTIWPEGSFSGYAGCSIFGNYEVAGDQMLMGRTTSIAAVTTTVPRPPATIDPTSQASVPPPSGCEAVSDQERQLLALLDNGQGVVDDNQFTITNDTGATASFRRA